MTALKAGEGEKDSQRSSTGIIIGQAKDVYQAMRFLEDEDREKFFTLCLNAKSQVTYTELISIGTLTTSLIHPREVFKAAIKNNSASIICVHNHPSGDPTPSQDDINITQKLKEAGEIIGIKVLDHIIIGRESYYSLNEHTPAKKLTEEEAEDLEEVKKMKVKKLRIGIKSIEEALEDAKETMKKLQLGEKVKKETGVYFTSLEAFRKALTPKRLELLHIIKAKKPASINELARMSHRDIKNISDDVKYLEQIGLIEKEESDQKTRPVITYDRIDLQIAV